MFFCQEANRRNLLNSSWHLKISLELLSNPTFLYWYSWFAFVSPSPLSLDPSVKVCTGVIIISKVDPSLFNKCRMFDVQRSDWADVRWPYKIGFCAGSLNSQPAIRAWAYVDFTRGFFIWLQTPVDKVDVSPQILLERVFCFLIFLNWVASKILNDALQPAASHRL